MISLFITECTDEELNAECITPITENFAITINFLSRQSSFMVGFRCTAFIVTFVEIIVVAEFWLSVCVR